MNAALAPSLGMVRGVTHAEYIRAHADGRYYFLEIAARVGGAFIADLVDVSTGINLWREWAKLEVSHLRGEAYAPPTRAVNTPAASCAWPRPLSPTRPRSTTGDRDSHEKAPPRRADCPLGEFGTREGIARPVQR